MLRHANLFDMLEARHFYRADYPADYQEKKGYNGERSRGHGCNDDDCHLERKIKHRITPVAELILKTYGGVPKVPKPVIARRCLPKQSPDLSSND
jgi:hypothetical protein